MTACSVRECLLSERFHWYEGHGFLYRMTISMSTSDEGLEHYLTKVCLALMGCHAGIHVAMCRRVIAYDGLQRQQA